MKKLLATGLCAAMACTMLAGCSGGGDKEYDLYVAGLDGGFGVDGWNAVIDAFEEQEGVKVKRNFDKNIAESLKPVIQSGKELPDVIYLSVGSAGGLTDTMIREKQLVDISDVLDMEVPGEKGVKVKDKILPGYTEGAKAQPYGDGTLRLAPLNSSPCGLFYNATLLKENGWEVPQTWDDMWKLGDEAKAKGIYLFTYPTPGYFDAFFASLLNATAGPEVYTKLMNYDVEAWKSPEVKEAFEIVGKLAQYVEPTTVANANKEGFTKNQQLVLDGKAIFVCNGSWLPAEMADAPRTEGFEWGVMGIPAVKEGGTKYFTDFTEQMYIPEGAENVDLAKKFIAFCYSDEAVKLFNEKGKGAVMPTKTGVDLVSDENRFMYEVDATPNSNGFMAVEPVEGVDVSSETGILFGTVNSVVSGDKTVDEWYDAVVEGVEKIAEANK